MCIFLPTSPVGFVCGVFTCAGALLCFFWFWLCFFSYLGDLAFGCSPLFSAVSLHLHG